MLQNLDISLKTNMIVYKIGLTLVLLVLINLLTGDIMEGSESRITPIIYLFVSNIVRFVTPCFNRHEWSNINSELKQELSDLHFGLANDLISPSDAGNKFSEITHDFFKTKTRIHF